MDEFVRSDAGVSGQSLWRREGLQELMRLASQTPRPFDGIIIDDTSRFGRNLSDTLPLTDRLKYSGVILYFVAQQLDSRNANFRQLFIASGQKDEQFSQDLGYKVRRGQRGRVLKGFVASGQTYGYLNVPVEHPTEKGLYGRPRVVAVNFVINPEQATMVNRILELYVSGMGRRLIARTLHLEGVPSPLQTSSNKKRRTWNATTIGKMLLNEKYRGVHTWNRTKTVINPNTGRKEHHPRPPSDWDRVEVPEWRIVSEELWNAKCAEYSRRREKGIAQSIGGSNRTEASRGYIFSGLLRCALCEKAITIVQCGKATVRYGCSSHAHDGKCPNNRTILQRRLQDELIKALSNNLLDPDLQREMSKEFHVQLRTAWEDRVRSSNQLAGRRKELMERRTSVHEQAQRFVDAIASGARTSFVDERLNSLQDELKTLDHLLAIKSQDTGKCPSAEMVEDYLTRKATNLAAVLNGDPITAKLEMCKRVTFLTLMPIQTPKGLFFEVEGDIRLFAGTDDAVLDTTMRCSGEQYTSLRMPFRTTFLQSPLRNTKTTATVHADTIEAGVDSCTLSDSPDFAEPLSDSFEIPAVKVGHDSEMPVAEILVPSATSAMGESAVCV